MKERKSLILLAILLAGYLSIVHVVQAVKRCPGPCLELPGDAVPLLTQGFPQLTRISWYFDKIEGECVGVRSRQIGKLKSWDACHRKCAQCGEDRNENRKDSWESDSTSDEIIDGTLIESNDMVQERATTYTNEDWVKWVSRKVDPQPITSNSIQKDSSPNGNRGRRVVESFRFHRDSTSTSNAKNGESQEEESRRNLLAGHAEEKSELDIMLDEGEETVVRALSEDYKNIILMMGSGVSESEKFMATQLLTRNNSQLMSKKFGRAKYVLVDNTKNSRRIFYPQLSLGFPFSNMALCQCPSFQILTTNPVSTYFSKYVLERAESVKIVLVLTPPELTTTAVGKTRSVSKAFTAVIQNLVSLIQNIPKFSNSIALIASSLSWKHNPETMIKQVGSYLEVEGMTYAEKLIREAKTPSEMKMATNIRAFIQAVTTKSNVTGDYNRIAILSPLNREGTLNIFPQIQKDKTYIQKMISENIQFQSNLRSDFDFSLSVPITELVQNISERMRVEFNAVEKEIVEDVNFSILTYQSLGQMRDRFESGSEVIRNTIVELAKSVQKPIEYVQMYKAGLLKLGFGITKKRFEKIEKYGRYLEFLKSMNQSVVSVSFGNDLKVILDKFGDGVKWTKALLHVYSKMSEYKYQSYRTHYNVLDLNEWGKGNGKGRGIQVSSTNFKQFCKLVDILEDDVPKNLTNEMLKDLNHVLKLTLQSPEPKVSIVNNTLTLSGTFVFLSQIKSNMTSSIKLVKIWAHNTLFIDQSIIYPGVSFSLFAPNWEVISSQSIKLDGRPGQRPPPVNDHGTASYPGTPGKPGLPGETAGNFIGVGAKFINLDKLEISANGGNGENGEDGIQGDDGPDGNSPTYPSSKPPDSKGRTYPTGKKGEDWTVEDTYYTNEAFYHEESNFFHVFGSKGGVGGRGGDGGVGGVGGEKGRIHIIDLNAKDSKIQETKDGVRGRDGIGGKGGLGGRRGKERIISWSIKKPVFSQRKEWAHNRIGDYGPRSASGANGNNGANKKDIQNHSPQTPIQDWAKHLNQFKQYLRSNLFEPVTQFELSVFASSIENSTQLNVLYNEVGYLDDLIGLERQFFSIYKHVNLVSTYESLLARLDHYSNSTTILNNKDPHHYKRKVLAYTYTTALSKLVGLKSGNEKSLIIDLHGYIHDIVLPNINDLKTVKKSIAITRQKEEYGKTVNENIREAHQFITQDLEPEIEGRIDELNTDVNLLIKETKEKEADAEKYKEDLIAKKEKLKEQLKLHKIFGIIKIVGAVAGTIGSLFAGPEVGVAVGELVSTGTSIAESYTLDDNKPGESIAHKIPQSVASGVESIKGLVKAIKDRKAESLKAQVNELKSVSTSEKLGDLNTKLNEIDRQLENEKSKNSTDVDSVKRVSNLNEKLKGAVDSEKKKLENDVSKGGEEGKEAEGKLVKLKKVGNEVVKVGKVFIEQYKEYKNDKDSLKAIQDAIEDADVDIMKLEEFEHNIYDTLIPMLGDIAKNVESMEKSLGSKSQIGLDVFKWKIQSVMNTFIMEITQATAGLNVEPKFRRTLEKITEGLITLTSVYDKIQSFQDRQKLGNYIANIGSPGSLSIDDGPYKTYVQALEQLIQCNLILTEFEQLSSGFKQWVFPLVTSNGLDSLYLPDSLKVPIDGTTIVEEMVTNTVTQVKAIKLVLDQYRDTSGPYDKYMENSNFNPNGVPNPPFFTWLNGEYHSEALFSGQPILLHSDVHKRKTEKEAIKFRSVQLALRLSDSDSGGSQTTEFNGLLNHYKVILTHGGNSYYSFGGKIYLISTEEQVIVHSFNRKRDGTPVTTNDVYDKISKGDILLSPFAWWKVQIVPNSADTSGSELLKLKEFVKDHRVKILLVGSGKYVDQNGKGGHIPTSGLDKYYRVIDNI